MRNFVKAVSVIGAMSAAVSGARAADMPDLPFLRGSYNDTPVLRAGPIWQGYYIGGQAGVGRSDMNFVGATRDMAARLLNGLTIENEYQVSQWPTLGKTTKGGTGYGGFAGYNSQWDDVVIGVEASYLHGSYGGSATGSMGRSFNTTDGYTNGVDYRSDASILISDVATLRARAAYAYYNFLPYVFGGAAIGLGDISRSATISGVQVNASAQPGFTNIPFSLSATDSVSRRLLIGYTAGVGVDVNLIGGLFLRAEYEYIRFTSTVDTNINTVRAGLGYKF